MMTYDYVIDTWTTRDWPLYSPFAWLYIFIHIICVLLLILCSALRFLKYKPVHNSNWNSPFLIEQSTTIWTIHVKIKVRYPSLVKLIYIFTHFFHSPHSSFTFETDGLWYCGESYLLGTLHPPRPGPNLFYVVEEEEPDGASVSPNPGRK